MNSTDMSKLGNMPEWNLTDLYPGVSSRELLADQENSRNLAEKFQKDYQGKLQTLAESFPQNSGLLDAVRAYEKIQDIMGRLASYAFLGYAGNTSNPENAKFFGDMQERLTANSSYLLFFALELNKIPDETLDKAVSQGELTKYKPWFDDLRKEKPYQLDDELEKLFHEKSVTGRMAWNRLFTETMTSLRFKVGEEEMALEQTLNLLLNKEEEKRREASEALSEVFASKVSVFTLITNTLAKDKEISDRWRSFEDVADSRHLSNCIEREVVDALESSVRAKYPALSHRYYALKAKWMGKKKLAQWDRNAPALSAEQKTYSWDEAQTVVVDSYAGFSPDVANIVQKFFDKNWIDAPIREGKRSGAFAHPTVPSAHPYIMLNYQGSPRDVMTLAHELGHGVHQFLANEQGALLAPTPLTLAETASVFGEMLTFKSLLSNETDPQKKKALIASKVEDMINTVVRQIAFYSFEREVHLARRNGELTSEQIGEIWMGIQHESLGPSVELKKGYENFWCYIPHFINSPFYVYAYAFGECLVNSLYAEFEKNSTGFQDKYIDLLKAGGSKNHIELLAPFGLNATDPGFWDMGLSVIENLIDQLEEM